MTLINAHSLAIGYNSKSSPALAGINFQLPAGHIHGLVGPNGVGKTTLLRTIAGQLKPLGGELTVAGDQPFDNQKVLDRVVLVGIDVSLPDNWTVRRLFAVAANRWPTWDPAIEAEGISIFGLGEQMSTTIGELSRGQRSAVGIIMGLATRCEIILMDEPYLGLDPERRQTFYRFLRTCHEQGDSTIVISTHHLNDVAPLLDSVVVLGLGGVHLTGSTEDVLESMLELTGTAEAVDTLARSLPQGAVLSRSNASGMGRILVDTTVTEGLTDRLFQMQGLRVHNVTLEQAVLALSQRGSVQQ